jgi:transcriptional regulator with XRE-family HTH domain
VPSAPPPPDRLIARRRAVGARIRALREQHNLSQEELAERAGRDRQAINRIEQGHSSPKLDTLLCIAEAMGEDPAEFFR